MSPCTESDSILMRNRFSAPYGTYIIAIWSAVLGLQNLARLIYTLATDGTGSRASQTQLFIYQWIGVIFTIIFFAAAGSIWQRKNWGRRLFLFATPPFFALAIFGVFSSTTADLSTASQWGLVIRYAISIAIPLVYLNLPFVTQAFLTETKEITPYD